MKRQSNLQKKIGIFFGIVVACGVLGVTIFYTNQSSNITSVVNQTTVNRPNSNTPINSSPTITPISIPATKIVTPTKTTALASYTFAQVVTHSSYSSCWTIIQNNVYDLTSWINQHPGGRQAILNLCGKDGTVAFVKQHGGQARPQNELKNFLIGVYAK